MISSLIKLARSDNELPVLWQLEVHAHNGERIELYLNQGEMEELQDGMNDLLNANTTEYQLEVS